jgi:hypothetical protein
MGCINETTDVGSTLATSCSSASLDERLSYNEMFTRHKLAKQFQMNSDLVSQVDVVGWLYQNCWWIVSLMLCLGAWWFISLNWESSKDIGVDNFQADWSFLWSYFLGFPLNSTVLIVLLGIVIWLGTSCRSLIHSVCLVLSLSDFLIPKGKSKLSFVMKMLGSKSSAYCYHSDALTLECLCNRTCKRPQKVQFYVDIPHVKLISTLF